jgi:tRNA pseudouridine55 synthase
MANPAPKKIRLPIDGVLRLDKPTGLSSNDALIKVKRLFNAKKAGHTGTLDPFATGLLPLCFGEATKFSQDLLESDKTYEAIIHFGVTTSTGDTEGEVLQTRTVNLSTEEIEAALARFRGEIDQVPPMYSALKRDGKPLYEYARAGITLEREARRVTIYQLDFIAYQAPYLTVRVQCSKGTYIRVLGEDIGETLGCGGHLQALRRVQVGHLTIEQAHTLEAIALVAEQDRIQLLAPVDELLSSFPAISLSAELAQRFLQGQRLSLGKEGMTPPVSEGRVRVYREQQLLGTGLIKEFGVLAPERLIAAGIR